MWPRGNKPQTGQEEAPGLSQLILIKMKTKTKSTNTSIMRSPMQCRRQARAGRSLPPHGRILPCCSKPLKEELFELEVERKQGHLSLEGYEKTKSALDRTLERALKREAATKQI